MSERESVLEFRDWWGDLSHKVTPLPWRKKRESLDADHPEKGPGRWEIVAGKSVEHRNMGHFHPDDSIYTMDEFTVVGFGYDRDYHFAEGGIENEADADLIVQAVNEYPALLACAQAMAMAIYTSTDQELQDALEAGSEALQALDRMRGMAE